jgi:CheY-like chemotaxis protein
MSVNANFPEKPRILLVDDNDMQQKILSNALKKYDVIFDVAVNGQEAVKLCNEHHYDLIIMDYEMPVMQGNAATKEILSQHEDWKDLHIVIQSDVKPAVYEENFSDITDPRMENFGSKISTPSQVKKVLTKYVPSLFPSQTPVEFDIKSDSTSSQNIPLGSPRITPSKRGSPESQNVEKRRKTSPPPPSDMEE